MSKVDTFQDLLLAPYDGRQDRWRWLYTELRGAIMDGRLRPGATLPSTRNLAAQYDVARGTVMVAFQQLHAEGYLVSEKGVGTRVSLDIAHGTTTKKTPRPHAGRLSRQTQKALRGAALLPIGKSVGRAFRAYEPAIDLFPVETWARVSSRVLRHAPRSLYGQGEPCGYMPLRRAIAEYVGASRGVRCTAAQVIVTAGSQQALDLLCRSLLDQGDKAWVEDPGYPGALQAMRAAGASLVPVPVDAEGIVVDEGRRLAPKAKLAYVTPSNQFPLGVTMSASRRLELLRWAAHGAWVIEDEYDAEYRYDGHPVASLHSLDRADCVLYVGTFTKMLFNALRLGFVIVPERLVAPLELARSFIDRHPPTLDQAVLAEFIADGHFGRHVRRMRQIYGERMQVLVELGRKHLRGTMEIQPAASGMKTIGWIENGLPDLEVARRASAVGLEVVPLSIFSQKAAQKPGVMLGFAGCDQDEMKRGVLLLKSVLSRRGV
jgi:GntR family transcriptional regulator/MocR family aminotransferase